jgi:hypothetical protein
MRDDLLARIDELGGEDARPVVPLDLFFQDPAAARGRRRARAKPDEPPPDDADNYGWRTEDASRPPGAPPLRPGYRPVVLFWD